MKIAIWSDTFSPQVNGVASVARSLADTYTELGHDVAVFSVIEKNRVKKSSGNQTFSVYKVPSFSMPRSIYPGEGLTIALPSGPKTIRALQDFKPDIIHVHTPFLAGWGAVLGKKILHVPLVGTHHTFFDDYLRHVRLDYAWGRKFSWNYTVAYYNRSDAVTVPSRALKSALM
jgi:glycosyltransferase involved in cell wall biosynthesis